MQTDKFHQHIEYDIVLIYEIHAFHFVVQCISWQETYTVDAMEEDLIVALDMWFSRHSSRGGVVLLLQETPPSCFVSENLFLCSCAQLCFITCCAYLCVTGVVLYFKIVFIG